MISGMLPVLKPAGPSSAAIVGRVKRLTKCHRVGHAGTLDPAAEGVLVMAFNRATRLIPFLPTDKSYRAIVRLGSETDTLDAAGIVQQQSVVPDLMESEIKAVLQRFVGPQLQIPPLISARHYLGKRLYQRARQGEVVEPAPSSIVIYYLHLISWQHPDIKLEVYCSRGTYIRSLARDLGVHFGCGAHLHSLQRTVCSGFSLKEAISWETLESEILHNRLFEIVVSPARALRHLPEIQVNGETRQAIQNGCRIVLSKTESVAHDKLYRMMDEKNRLLAIARPEGEEMKMERVLCPSNEEPA